MGINWTVRFKNSTFWIAFIPALLLLAQQVCALFGIALNVSELTEQLIAIVGTIFTILALMGVVADPTTAGIHDSEQAMTYETPRK
jgi:phi LC3 family holin